MILFSTSKISVFALMTACLALSSCSDNPVEDVKTTLNIFMPDTSSMNVDRFRKETAPGPGVGYQYADSGEPLKMPMRPQSTKLASAYTPPPIKPSNGYPAAPK